MEILNEAQDISDEPPLVKVYNSNIKLDLPLFNFISKKTRQFINLYFPQVTDAEWNDWHWQIKNRIQTVERL